MKYDEFFKHAFGKESDKDFGPFDYQHRLCPRWSGKHATRGCKGELKWAAAEMS